MSKQLHALIYILPTSNWYYKSHDNYNYIPSGPGNAFIYGDLQAGEENWEYKSI